jgi:uncharacterized protein with PIN domain
MQRTPNGIGTVELPEEELDLNEITSDSDTPPIFGRCPACGKPLFPCNRYTGDAQAPEVGTGYNSRARCNRCGAILYYKGKGEWGVLTQDMLSEEDVTKDNHSPF